MSSDHKDENKTKERLKTAENIGKAITQTDTVNRYGAGIKEHLVAYGGVDNENGITYKKSLKSIAKSKVNPNNQSQNINQQAGFSAETKTTAKENAENAIAGKKTRTVRTDDVPKQTAADGTPIGGTNDPLSDLISIDEKGNYIEGSARQLKYVGDDPKDCCSKLLSKKYDKYRDNDVSIEVPKDYYDKIHQELDNRAANLEKRIENAQKKGDTALAEKHKQQLERVRKTKENLRKGKLTKKEAQFARLHPKLSTAGDIVKLSHRAGVRSAKSSAAIGGGMSFIRNSVAVLKGDEDPEEAVREIAKDTALSAGNGYATSFVGSAIKGTMQNAQSTYIRAVSTTALPAVVATSVIEAGKTIFKFASGQIDGTECLVELGEKGSGIAASTMGGIIGQALIPIPVVGGLIGSMVGYMMSSFYYNSLVSALQEAKMARMERIRIEEECQQAMAAIREYRLQAEIAIRNYFTEHISSFENAFSVIREGFDTENADLLIEGANSITEALGEEALFHNDSELDALMMSSGTIKI